MATDTLDSQACFVGVDATTKLNEPLTLAMVSKEIECIYQAALDKIASLFNDVELQKQRGLLGTAFGNIRKAANLPKTKPNPKEQIDGELSTYGDLRRISKSVKTAVTGISQIGNKGQLDSEVITLIEQRYSTVAARYRRIYELDEPDVIEEVVVEESVDELVIAMNADLKQLGQSGTFVRSDFIDALLHKTDLAAQNALHIRGRTYNWFVTKYASRLLDAVAAKDLLTELATNQEVTIEGAANQPAVNNIQTIELALPKAITNLGTLHSTFNMPSIDGTAKRNALDALVTLWEKEYNQFNNDVAAFEQFVCDQIGHKLSKEHLQAWRTHFKIAALTEVEPAGVTIVQLAAMPAIINTKVRTPVINNAPVQVVTTTVEPAAGLENTKLGLESILHPKYAAELQAASILYGCIELYEADATEVKTRQQWLLDVFKVTEADLSSLKQSTILQTQFKLVDQTKTAGNKRHSLLFARALHTIHTMIEEFAGRGKKRHLTLLYNMMNETFLSGLKKRSPVFTKADFFAIDGTLLPLEKLVALHLEEEVGVTINAETIITRDQVSTTVPQLLNEEIEEQEFIDLAPHLQSAVLLVSTALTQLHTHSAERIQKLYILLDVTDVPRIDCTQLCSDYDIEDRRTNERKHLPVIVQQAIGTIYIALKKGVKKEFSEILGINTGSLIRYAATEIFTKEAYEDMSKYILDTDNDDENDVTLDNTTTEVSTANENENAQLPPVAAVVTAEQNNAAQTLKTKDLHPVPNPTIQPAATKSINKEQIGIDFSGQIAELQHALALQLEVTTRLQAVSGQQTDTIKNLLLLAEQQSKVTAHQAQVAVEQAKITAEQQATIHELTAELRVALQQ